MKREMPEIPIIRPPSEWKSVLVRLTRGCKWNRCRFCGIYPHMGEPGFSRRTVNEVKQDIDLHCLYRTHYETAFFGDSDPLQIGLEEFIEIAGYLRQQMPAIKRLTCYARASTLWKIKQNAISRLAVAGLNRIHIGLESGDEETLRYHRKGQSSKMVLETATWLKEAGIEISYYVLLGLGGLHKWKHHILKTAEIVNQSNPDFVRLRRLWLFSGDSPVEPGCPLIKEIQEGNFVPQTPEGTVLELKLFLENLQGISSFITCDHANNYVRVAGKMMEDREDMLAEINDFLSLPQDQRQAHYQAVGSQI